MTMYLFSDVPYIQQLYQTLGIAREHSNMYLFWYPRKK